MEINTQFDILAGELNDQERRQMLSAIRKSLESEAAPIVSQMEPEPPEIELQMKSLGLWDRVRIFFAQLFSGRTKEEIVQGWMVRDLHDSLHKANVPGIDARTRQFREPFAKGIEDLQRAANTLTDPFEISQRHRTELVLALAMQFFPGVHQEIVRKTSEQHIQSLNEDSERYLKRQLTTFLEQTLTDIPTTARTETKNALHQADAVYRLVTFPYANLLASFEGTGMETGRHCAFEYVSRNLELLVNALSNLTGPLDLSLLETLTILNLKSDEVREDETDFQEAIRTGLTEITAALGQFRGFSDTFPLQTLMRSIKEDPWWMPRMEESGEDWISLYKTFFADRIHRVVLRVTLENQIAKYIDTLREIAGEEPRPINGLPDGSEGIRSTRWYQAMAMKTLVGKIRATVYPHLKIVLTGGEFYKSSNRAQYNDAFGEFEKIPQKVAEIERNLASDGIWGSIVWGDIVVAQRRQMADRIDHEISRAVEITQTTVEMLVNVLGGILYARPGSPYDTLANYGQIGGRRNAEFIDDLKDTHAALQAFMSAMGEFGAIEKRAIENQIELSTEIAVRSREKKARRNAPDL